MATTIVRSGSCLCGNVRYEAKGNHSVSVLCHCMNCQKASGSAFMNNVFYPEQNVIIKDESKSLRAFKDDIAITSGNYIMRYFCSNCGSPLFSRPGSGPNITVCTGTLDSEKDRADVAPNVEGWCHSQRDYWAKVSSGVNTTKFDGSFIPYLQSLRAKRDSKL